jgi:molybdopterin-guanine dinucleotide biosynthesis protein A
LRVGGDSGLDIYSAVIGNDKIRGVERKIHFQVEMLHDREEVELPEAGIEGGLELFYELSVTVLKVACPLIQHILIECIREFRDHPKIRVLRFFADDRRE